jgi:preprotein translocase SecE subunit
MFTFIREAIQEIKHVVWPTPAETRKYFTIVTVMIISATVILSIVGLGLTTGMFAIRSVTPHEVTAPVADSGAEARASRIIKELGAKSNSGSLTATGAKTDSGSTIRVSTGATTNNNQ